MTAIDWAPWRPLLGEWTARGGGEPGQGAGAFSFALELNDYILVRRARTEYPASPDRPAFAFEDLLVIYPDDDGFAGIVFDNEGHVIRYRAVFEPRRIALVSDGTGPRFRLTYELARPNELDIRFEIAQAGSDDFAVHVSGSAERKAVPDGGVTMPRT